MIPWIAGVRPPAPVKNHDVPIPKDSKVLGVRPAIEWILKQPGPFCTTRFVQWFISLGYFRTAHYSQHRVIGHLSPSTVYSSRLIRPVIIRDRVKSVTSWIISVISLLYRFLQQENSKKNWHSFFRVFRMVYRNNKKTTKKLTFFLWSFQNGLP